MLSIFVTRSSAIDPLKSRANETAPGLEGVGYDSIRVRLIPASENCFKIEKSDPAL